jgi:Holliday junction resolvasome RuvABC ATP-dependent DNA helicase subunit
MQRRKFLTLAGLGAAAIAVPVIGFGSVSARSAVTGIIMKELDYLKLDKTGVEQYAAEYIQHETGVAHLEAKLKLYHIAGIGSDKSSIVSSLVERYLLSTDFFLNKMDESRTIKYTGYYNPYKTPCTNPFSSLYYPENIT